MREDEEKKRSQDEGVQRTQKGFQILSERGEHDTTSKQCYTPGLDQSKECSKNNIKSFPLLYPSDGSEDPATTPFLEIADQKGNPLQIPDDERKVCINSCPKYYSNKCVIQMNA